eukprot:5017709-Alexandrium_andersonii.AAC.1
MVASACGYLRDEVEHFQAAANLYTMPEPEQVVIHYKQAGIPGEPKPKKMPMAMRKRYYPEEGDEGSKGKGKSSSSSKLPKGT